MTDSFSGDRFDPRFNPAFQPGYDPSVHARPTVVPKRSAAPELIEDPPLPTSAIPPTELSPTPSVFPNAVDESAVARRFDPYLAGLWALSVVFVAAGLLTVRYIADRMDRLSATAGSTAFDYNLVLVYTIASPLLVILGLATATATLFLLASRRRR